MSMCPVRLLLVGHASACLSPMAYYRRNLPHWHPEEAWLFITWRLHGSLPVSRAKPASPTVGRTTAGQASRSWDALLDGARSGPVWLKDPRLGAMVAGLVEQAGQWPWSSACCPGGGDDQWAQAEACATGAAPARATAKLLLR